MEERQKIEEDIFMYNSKEFKYWKIFYNLPKLEFGFGEIFSICQETFFSTIWYLFFIKPFALFFCRCFQLISSDLIKKKLK